MDPIAVIDIGTNSIRILAVKRNSDGGIETILRAMKIVRLGEEVDKNRLLSPYAMDRGISALRELKSKAQESGISSFFPLATSAVRDAGNREEFVERVKDETGLNIKVLSGIEEAELSFQGAVWDFEFEFPVLVIDIGGGSTEFTIGRRKPVFSESIDIGAVRITERFFKNDPITKEEYKKAALFIKNEITLIRSKLQKHNFRTAIGVGGTMTTLAAIEKGLKEYNPEYISGFCLTLKEVDRIIEKLLAKTTTERQKIPGLQPERADIIPAGALIVKTIIETISLQKIIVRDSDLLLGYALKVFNMI